MSLPAIISSIRAVLGTYATQPLLTNAANDLYEAYVFTLALRAARDERATITLRDRDGAVVNRAVFRRAPGFLHSHGRFTHALIEFARREPLEMHIGIAVAGVSQQAHECDIAILKNSECERSRNSNGVLPRSRGLILAFEAKYYSSYLPIHIGRGFLGLDTELWGTTTGLVTNIESEDVVSLILHHKAQADDGVLPGAGADDRLVGFIRNVFHRYKH